MRLSHDKVKLYTVVLTVEYLVKADVAYLEGATWVILMRIYFLCGCSVLTQLTFYLGQILS